MTFTVNLVLISHTIFRTNAPTKLRSFNASSTGLLVLSRNRYCDEDTGNKLNAIKYYLFRLLQLNVIKLSLVLEQKTCFIDKSCLYWRQRSLLSTNPRSPNVLLSRHSTKCASDEHIIRSREWLVVKLLFAHEEVERNWTLQWWKYLQSKQKNKIRNLFIY